MPRATWLLALLWLAFVVRGFWYCALLPPWEGYDEPFHFAALQHVAAGEGMPRANTPISLEVQKSLHLLPLPWELQFQAIPQPLTTHDDFWKLPPEERQRRIDALRALATEEGSQPAVEPVMNYESQQAPLYYWLFAVPLRWMSSLSLLSRVYLMRLLGFLLASIAIPLACWIARRVLRSDLQALGVTAIIVLLPELMINLARVGNESLALVVYSLLLAATVQVVQRPHSWPRWLLFGAALGFGLLTKAYFLTTLPAMIAVAAISVWLNSGTDVPRSAVIPALLRLGAALAVAFVIAGRWYAHVHSATGSWSGQSDDVALRNVSLLHKLAASSHVNWKSGILSVLISHVWFGGWSFLRVPIAIYMLTFSVIALAAIGGAVRLQRPHELPVQRRDIMALMAFYACFWAGLAYHVLITYLSLGVSSSTGWYLFAAVVAEVIPLVWGLEAFLPGRIVLPLLAIGAAALDLYGTHALLMPYYTGVTAHTGGSVPPAFWPTLAHLPLVFSRVSELRPAWLGTRVLLGWWIGYWIATVGTAVVVVLLFRRASAES